MFVNGSERNEQVLHLYKVLSRTLNPMFTKHHQLIALLEEGASFPCVIPAIFHSSYETLLIRQKCKQYILKWDAVGSILKQTKRKHQLTIKTCIKYVDKK
jgi:hypothetical protein